MGVHEQVDLVLNLQYVLFPRWGGGELGGIELHLLCLPPDSFPRLESGKVQTRTQSDCVYAASL